MNLGAGITLQMSEITENDLQQAVIKLLSDTDYNDACSRIGKSFQLAGGYKKAVEYILGFGKGRFKWL